MRAVRIVLTIIVVLITVGGVMNVFTDDAAVRSAAEAVACPHGCTKASEVRVDRTIVAETVEYTMSDRIVRVRCSRAGIVVGPYSCALK
jgi:hypothetical protein